MTDFPLSRLTQPARLMAAPTNRSEEEMVRAAAASKAKTAGKATRGPGRRKPASAEMIRTVASRLFAQRGYYNTSMQDIASKVGITKGSLYHHVPSKEAILDSLVFAAIDDLLNHTETLVAAGHPPRQRFEEMVRLMVRNMAEHQSGTAIYVTERLRLPTPLRRKYAQPVRRHRELFEASAAELLATEKPNAHGVDLPLAIISILGLANITSLWYQPRGRLSLSEIEEQYIAFALRILGLSDNATLLSRV